MSKAVSDLQMLSTEDRVFLNQVCCRHALTAAPVRRLAETHGDVNHEPTVSVSEPGDDLGS